ncbi:PQQ-binding-like beta-propeller repeat protein [Gracilimonas sediminicola]|uniref:PQQ-binding-like beta-propeller repeat protein n=1 Tax=Gracilimonas sediminicola TaxID=2952158 RepID=A0A9X2L4U5_9BACT|nr:PQQ-binding-like beta-propeller repeat protein [Gracilimonas sediminicola]MCP9292252.1 PQQ-binding-like beta-propeller repeat protein [Gracilimonas sediminicola]
MKYLKFVFLIFFTQSCFTTSDKPKNEDPVLPQLWEYSYEHVDAPNHPPLVTNNGMVVMSGDAHITALSVENGTLIWQKEDFGVYLLAGAKLLENENQLFTNHFDELIAWNKSTGDRLWTVPIDSPLTVFKIGTHAIFNNGYAIVGLGSQLYTVNVNGGVEYIKNLGMPVAHVGSNSQKLFAGQAKTVHGGLSFGRITSLDANTGDSLWAYNTENSGFVYAAPIVEDGVVYAGAAGNSPRNVFVALDAKTGAIIWEFITDDSGKWTRNFTIGPKHLFFAGDARLFALDKSTGELAWEYSWEGSAFVQQEYLEGYVYHSDHGSIFVLDVETGDLVHEQQGPEGGGYIWHLTVSENKLLVQTSSKLVAYQPWHLRED